jgi:hypothetical protein
MRYSLVRMHLTFLDSLLRHASCTLCIARIHIRISYPACSSIQRTVDKQVFIRSLWAVLWPLWSHPSVLMRLEGIVCTLDPQENPSMCARGGGGAVWTREMAPNRSSIPQTLFLLTYANVRRPSTLSLQVYRNLPCSTTVSDNENGELTSDAGCSDDRICDQLSSLL